MEYVSSGTLSVWYGAPCQQPITVIEAFGGKLPVNSKAARLFRRLDAIFQECNPHYYNHDMKPDRNEWGYVCRKIGGSTSYSKHAWGLAVDVEASENNQGVPFAQTEIWKKAKESCLQAEKEGFTWGGRFSNPDAMHFEVAVSPEWITERYKRNGTPRGWWAKELGLKK